MKSEITLMCLGVCELTFFVLLVYVWVKLRRIAKQVLNVLDFSKCAHDVIIKDVNDFLTQSYRENPIGSELVGKIEELKRVIYKGERKLLMEEWRVKEVLSFLYK